MADKTPELAKGFQEVPLAEGFQDVPLNEAKGTGGALLDKAKDAGNYIVDSAKSLGQDAADTARGVEQGVTFGAAPIIHGATEATYDKLKSLIDGGQGKDWLDAYRQHQQESSKNFKDAEERSPWLYGAGEVGGAVGTGLLTGGVGAGGAAIAKQGLAKTLGKAALKGAGVGAVSGALSSEGNLDDEKGRNKMLADAVGGGLAGGVFAPGMEVTGKVLGKGFAKTGKYLGDKASELAEDNPLLRQMKRSRDLGKAGFALNSSQGSRTTQGHIQDDAIKGFTDQFLNARNVLGKDVSDPLAAATASGAMTHLGTDASDAMLKIQAAYNVGHIGDMENAEKIIPVLKNLADGDNGKFTPQALEEYLPTIQTLIDKTEDPALKSPLIELKNKAKQQVGAAAPGVDAAKKTYENFNTNTAERFTNKSTGSSWLGDSPDPEGKLGTGIEGFLNSAQNPGASSPQKLSKLDDVVKHLESMEAAQPGFLAKIGIDPKTLNNEMTEASDHFAMSRAVLGADPKSDPTSSIWTMLGGAATGRGQLIHKANLLGRIEKSVSESPVADFSRQLYNWPSEKLTSVANTMKSTPGLERIGSALERGISEKNESLKNAALFTIMQNPKARLLISGQDVE